MNILIVDTETTGLSPDKGDKVIEIAAILYNLEHKTILQAFSTMFPCDENPVQHINGISPEASRLAMCMCYVSEQLQGMIEHASCIVAHNAEFDRKFVNTLNIEKFNSVPWVCTVKQFNWGVQLSRKRLQDVCQALDVPYVNAHRALNDCLFMVDCFNKLENLETRFSGLQTK